MTDEQLLQEAVDNSKWLEVVWYLRQNYYSNPLRRWAVEEIAKHGSFDNVQEILFEGLADDHLDTILPHLMSRNMWLTVKFACGRSNSTETKEWVVVQASEHASDAEFVHYILDETIESYPTDWSHVLTRLVSRGMWQSVGRVLQYNISDEQHAWAAEEASKNSNDDNFWRYILPCCSEKELKQATPHLVARGLWKSVKSILEHSTDPTQRHWVIQEAIKHAEDKAFVDHVLPCCWKGQPEELEQVLMHLVSRNLWKEAGSVLQRGVNRKSHEWAVDKASKTVDENDFVDSILCTCSEDELELVVTNMVARGLWEPADDTTHTDNSIKHHIVKQLVLTHQWKPLGVFLSRGIDAQQSRWAVEEAVKHRVDLNDFLSPQYTEFVPLAVEHGQWKWINASFNDMVFSTMFAWTGKHESILESKLWELAHNCRVPVCQALKLSKVAFQPRGTTPWLSNIYLCFGNLASLSEELAEPLIASMLNAVCYAMCSDDGDCEHNAEHARLNVCDIYTSVISCVLDNRGCVQDKTQIIQNKETWTLVFTEIANAYINDPLFLLRFLQGFHLFYSSRQGQNDDNILLMMFTVLPLFPQIQSVALRLMLRKKRWHAVSQACLSHVWEHDRRQLFKAAVEQRQWNVVKQWSDHTVHDDQRDWAMKEAFKVKQWDVYLLLADFGLTMEERMHAHYMVAKYADWDTVLQMLERGGDVEEVRWLLENFAKGRLRLKPHGDASVYEQRCQRLMEEENYLTRNSHMDPIGALKTGEWRIVLFNILHGPREDYFALVKNKAIREQAWHVLMHVVRLGMNSAERDDLFPDMVRHRQWAVCRMLLEYGVSFQLCLDALPKLIEYNQWTLVARVMEYNVDDAMRRQVMQCAFHRREGVLFWHCLITMKEKQLLTTVTREKLFHQAISREIWQAVKVLVEDKDGPGFQLRDMAFLEAIEQHLWDVVDHCQLYGADINMKDENGETPLHREVRKREWKVVEEIVFRDGRPNMLDKDGISVLNWLMYFKQWDTVKFVIKYGANIHLSARTPNSLKQNASASERFCSPLQTLISWRKMDIIQFTLMWCPEQGKGVTGGGETVLHAACGKDRWDLLWDLIARKADPLAVTRKGQSALVYAMTNREHPQRMVAECIRLGFCTHQPSLTRFQGRLVDHIIHREVLYGDEQFSITSPFLLALLRGNPVVTRMLYESGSCSYRELFTLYTQLPDLTDRWTEEGAKLYKTFHQLMIGQKSKHFMAQYHSIQQSLRIAMPFLTQVATTPRTLKSSCRLVISHSRDVHRKGRHLDVLDFDLLDELKDYVLFSDLTDPNYGKDLK